MIDRLFYFNRKLYGVPLWIILLAFINCIPVLAIQYFTTDDAGPHLYNSNILLEKLFHPESPLSQIYQINFTVTNWTSHLILGLFKLFFPAWLADKLLQISYVTFFVLTYYYMITSFKQRINFFFLLILPFAYSFNFYCGFYNFCIGLTLMFLTIGYWERFDPVKYRIKLTITILLTLIAVTHLFVFILTCFILIAIPIIKRILIEKDKLSKSFELLKYLLVLALPGCILFSIYKTQTGLGDATFLTKKELLYWLINIRPLVVFGFHLEPIWTRWLLPCLLAGLFMFFLNFKRVSLASKLFMFTASIFCVLFFLLPDSDGQGGYISLRLITIFFILLFSSLTLIDLPKILNISIAVIISFVAIMIPLQHYSLQQRLSDLVADIYKTSYFIAPYSTVVQVNRSDFWMENHYASYVAADKPILLLDNYEADAGYFPIKWNENKISANYYEVPNLELLNWKRGWLRDSNATIDYFLIFGKGNAIPDDKYIRIISSLKESNYKLAYSNENVILYEKCSDLQSPFISK